MIKTCDTCRYWMRLSEAEGTFTDGNCDTIEDGTGQCRFNPPAATYDPMAFTGQSSSSDAAMRALWPITWDRHWCGQHPDNRVQDGPIDALRFAIDASGLLEPVMRP